MEFPTMSCRRTVLEYFSIPERNDGYSLYDIIYNDLNSQIYAWQIVKSDSKPAET
jgi:hypothetical protein